MIDKHESITAKICSFVRAYHSAYSDDIIFDDNLAYDLLGQEDYVRVGQLIENSYDTGSYKKDALFDRNAIEQHVNEFLSPIPLSRIRYTEKMLGDFVKRNGKTQYVILGAGLDTFAFRNTDENIEIYELDHPDTGRYKKEKIKELEPVIPKNVHFVSIDFNKDNLIDVLLNAGFDRTVPTVFSILGVTYYLTLEIFENTLKMLDEITDSKAMVIFDYPDESTITNSDKNSKVFKLREMTAKLGEKMTYGYKTSELTDALRRHSFTVFEHKDPESINNTFFKDRTDGMRAYENVHFLAGVK